MSFSRFSLMLRLPLAAFFCFQLVFLSGNDPLGGNFTYITESVVSLDDRGDNDFFDGGLNAAIFEGASSQRPGLILLGLGYVPRGATLDLRATGPPNA